MKDSILGMYMLYRKICRKRILTHNSATETAFTKAQLAKYFKFDRIMFGFNVTRSVRSLFPTVIVDVLCSKRPVEDHPPVSLKKSLSTLAIHTRNLLTDPICMLVVQVWSFLVFPSGAVEHKFSFFVMPWVSSSQVPGWSGLSNAQVTTFDDVYPLPAEQQVSV
jgi:hypothetical protein